MNVKEAEELSANILELWKLGGQSTPYERKLHSAVTFLLVRIKELEKEIERRDEILRKMGDTIPYVIRGREWQKV